MTILLRSPRCFHGFASLMLLTLPRVSFPPSQGHQFTPPSAHRPASLDCRQHIITFTLACAIFPLYKYLSLHPLHYWTASSFREQIMSWTSLFPQQLTHCCATEEHSAFLSLLGAGKSVITWSGNSSALTLNRFE